MYLVLAHCTPSRPDQTHAVEALPATGSMAIVIVGQTVEEDDVQIETAISATERVTKAAALVLGYAFTVSP